ncbi:MAG: hypothetical protein Q9217_005212 [Psora testacea]
MTSPLDTLADYFRHHRITNEPLILGPNAQKSIVAFQSLHGHYKAAAVETVASIHKIESDTTSIASEKAKKKSDMSAALPPLMKDFVSSEMPDESRRWIGVLILELLTECAANARVLRNETHKRWRYLSEVVILSRRRLLRHLAGSIMRQLVFYGISLEMFHDVGDNKTLFTSFPNSQYHDSQWIITFENFVEDMLINDDCSEEEESSTFACGVMFGETSYKIDEEAAILTTVGREFNVIVPPSARRPAVYIDIPISNIRAIAADQRQNTQSQTPTYALQIELIQNGHASFYVNASPLHESSIFLAFKSQSAAADVRLSTESRIIAIGEGMPFSHSETDAIDVSKRRSGAESGHLEGLSSDSVSDDDNQSPSVSAIPVRPENVDSQRDPVQQRPLSLVQEMIERATSQPDISDSLPSMAVAAINVSIHRENEAKPAGADVAPEDVWESTLTDSLQWQNGLNLIESAPEFHDAPLEGDQKSTKITDARHERSELNDEGDATVAVRQAKPAVTVTAGSDEPTSARQTHQDAPGTQASVLPAGLPSKRIEQFRNGQGSLEDSLTLAKAPVLHASVKRGSTKASMLPPKQAIAAAPQAKTTETISTLPSQRKGAIRPKGKSGDDFVDGFGDEFSLLHPPLRPGSPKFSHNHPATPDGKNNFKPISAPPKRNARGTTKAASALFSQKTSGALTATAQKVASNNSNTNTNSTAPRNNTTYNEPDIWDEGLSVQVDEAPVSRNRGNQSKKRSAAPPKARTSKNNNSHGKNSVSHGRAPGKIRIGKVSTDMPNSVDVTPPAHAQPRSKRVAAVKANKRIEHQLGSEEVADELIIDGVVSHEIVANPETEPHNAAAAPNRSKAIRPVKPSLAKTTGVDSLSTPKNHPALPRQVSKDTQTTHAMMAEDLPSPYDVDRASTKPITQFGPKQVQAPSPKASSDPLSKQQEDDHTVPFQGIAHHDCRVNDDDSAFVPEGRANGVEALMSDGNDADPVVEYGGDMVTPGAVPKVSGTLTRPHNKSRNHQETPRRGKQNYNLQDGYDQDRHGKKQDQAVGQKAKEIGAPKPTNSKFFKDPFATKLGNIMYNGSGASGQLTIRNSNLKTQTSIPKEQVLTSTRAKDAGPAVALSSWDKEAPPAQEHIAAAKAKSSGTKRKVVESEQSPSKRAKAPPPGSSALPMKDSSISEPQKTPVTSIDRKAAIISFGKSGPKNQGVIATRYLGEATAIPSDDFMIPIEAKTPDTGIPIPCSKDVDPIEKTSDGIHSLANELHAANKLGSQVNINQRPSRVSSQRRITADGSPVIVSQNGGNDFAGESISTDDEAVEDALIAAKLDNGADIFMYNGDDNIPVPPRSVCHLDADADPTSAEPPSRDKRPQPSSPLEASTLADLDMHQIRDNDTIINVKTRRPVVSAVPHDPFQHGVSKRNSSFVEALRKSNALEGAAQGRVKAAQAGIRASLAAIEDPEKTLVEAPPSNRAGNRGEVRVIPSSSSGSSSADISILDSERIAHMNTDESRRAYEPHQEDMYLVLSGIANRLVQRQVKREKDLQNTIEEYSRGGKQLVQHFLDDCYESLEVKKENNIRAEADMAAFYKKSLQDLSKISKHVLNDRVKDIETQWSAHQQKLLDLADAALAACEV